MAAPLAPAGPGARPPAPDVRKTVTILFADLVDSSRLSLTLDPEALRNLLARYFGEMSAIVGKHGGTVEKYIGDAIMAVFGVPTLHEDDALRAVRGAIEMRDRLTVLNRDLEAGWGVRLASRIGVNTGEVIAGDHRQGHLFVTGEAVNVAKRLEEAAAANEILISRSTHQLVRDAVDVEPSGPRALKHGAVVDALVVRHARAHAPGLARHFESPFIGRQGPRSVLRTVFGGAVSQGSCHVLTVLGDAGVGKSRLVREFTAELGDDVVVLHGRCLPYGEGITYWPLAEIVRGIARAKGLEPDEQSAATIAARLAAEELAGEEKAQLIAQRVAETLGLGSAGGGTSEETFWAVRRLFEALARAGPLVVVVDDLHWAEPTFLDLVEHVADFSRGFPILLVCIARRDLLEIRPGWGSRKPNTTSIALEPLSEAECRELVSNLLGRAPVPPAAASVIAGSAEGNALFAEELVAMLVDDGLLVREDDRWVAPADLSELPVPSTIHALLAARLESLPADQRAILTTAAVEGVVFHRGAVGELAHPALDAALEDGLQTLVHRDLIRRNAADFAGEEAYRFRHGLIRDAAYRSLPKGDRADLHERYAGWLEAMADDRSRSREFEEIVGYHLEQAFRYRVAVGSLDSRAASLATRASERLEAAGRRALARSDLPAGIGLLERVTELLRTEDPRRPLVLAELGAAMIESGRLAQAGRVLDEAERLAAAGDDTCTASHVLVQRQFLRLLHVEEGGTEEAARTMALVIPVFERCADDLGLCRARRLEAWLHWNEARAEAAAAAWERAAAHAREAGDRHVRNEILTWVASSLWFGPTPADEGVRRCEAMREEVHESPESEAAILRHLAGLHAMLGRFDLARRLLATSNAAYADLGLTLNAATSQNEAVIELLAGNPAAAEESLRTGCRALEEMGERMFLPTTAAFLARAVFDQGRDVEAEELAGLSARLAGPTDLLSQVLWRGVRARVLTRRAELQEAEALAREAVALAGATDFLNHRADALLDLSHVLEASRRADEAVTAASEALRLYGVKGNVIAAAATRRRLEELGKRT
ncbi:ATP-binding protein [Geodermatophilus siccatus]|uniref:ATP-binding protein n=1 Tax=Geodermatophilus siccatus TaxID=1137991 RepID=UPI001C317067|nr:adenylate/guanylate cyclase domain-containing protein [Geodermatophilus siccatus]